MEGPDDNRRKVLWTCPQLGAKDTHRGSALLAATGLHHQANLAAGFRGIVPCRAYNRTLSVPAGLAQW